MLTQYKLLYSFLEISFRENRETEIPKSAKICVNPNTKPTIATKPKSDLSMNLVNIESRNIWIKARVTDEAVVHIVPTTALFDKLIKLVN